MLLAGACSAPDRNYDVGGSGTSGGAASGGTGTTAGSSSKGGKNGGGATGGDAGAHTNAGASGDIGSGSGGVQNGGSAGVTGDAGAAGVGGSTEGGAIGSSGGVTGGGGVLTSGGANSGGTAAGGTGTAGSSSGGGGGTTTVDCGALANPANGMVATSGTTAGSRASYSCVAGYQLSGVATRVCQNTGVWSDSAPTCTPVDCGALATPANGSVTAASTLYGSTARYSCSPGYGLVGPASRTCQASGVWSGADPSCEFCSFPVGNDTLLFWPLDEGKGQTVRDLGPNGLKGVLGATTAEEGSDPTWIDPARFGPGLSFVGGGRSGQYVYVPKAVPFPKNTFTVEVWVRPGQGNAQIFTAGSIILYLAVNAPVGLEWGIGDGINWTLDAPQAEISVGDWHYIAVTFDGSTMAAYLDGAGIGTKPVKPVTLGVPTEYFLGGRPNNTFLNGQLGPVRVSATAHTATQIAKAFEAASACPPRK